MRNSIKSRIVKLERSHGVLPPIEVIDDFGDKTLPVTAVEHGVTIYPRMDGEPEAELLARMPAIPVYEVRCMTILRGGSTDTL